MISSSKPVSTCARIALILSALFLPSDLWSKDWPHFLGPTLNLHCAETDLNLSFSVKGPAKLWEFEKGKGHAGPVVVDSHVILMHQLKVGEEDHEVVHCLDAATGKVKWKHSYPVTVSHSFGIVDAPRSSPSIDVETRTVYVLGNDSDLIALELDSGAVRWQMNLSEEFGEAPFFFGQGSSPLPYKNKLIVHAGSPGACVVALDKKTGAEIWRTAHQWNGSYASPIVTEINGVDRLMVFAGGKTKPPHGGLLCINPEDGKIDDAFPWRSTNFASVNASSPVPCGDNRVFITEDYGRGGVMLRFDVNFKIQEEWTTDYLKCQFQTPIYHDGVLYGFDGSGGMMVAIDARTGRILWSEGFFQTTIPWEVRGELRDIPISMGHAHMIHVQDSFLCISENGSLIHFFLSPQGPGIVSKARLFYAPETWAPPVISDGRLFINQNEFQSRLICYDLKAR